MLSDSANSFVFSKIKAIANSLNTYITDVPPTVQLSDKTTEIACAISVIGLSSLCGNLVLILYLRLTLDLQWKVFSAGLWFYWIPLAASASFKVVIKAAATDPSCPPLKLPKEEDAEEVIVCLAAARTNNTGIATVTFFLFSSCWDY